MQIPAEALPYIYFQRTAYLNHKKAKRLLDAVTVRFPFFYKPAVRLFTKVYAEEFKVSFARDMRDEFSQMLPYLPSSIDSLLDIGCGVAGFEVMLNEHYQNAIENYLLDKTSTDDKIHYSFEEKGSFYNSLDIAKRLLEMNGVPESKIHLQEATPDNKIVLPSETVDVVLSLISWCFHYPVETYLDEVYRVLKPGGTLIIDVRKGTGGEEKIRTRFTDQKTIREDKKSLRLCFRKEKK